MYTRGPTRWEAEREKREESAHPTEETGQQSQWGFFRVKRVKRSPRQIQLASKQRVVIAKRNAHWGDVERGDRLSIPLPPLCPMKAKGGHLRPIRGRETFSMHRPNEHREREKERRKKIFIFYNCIGGAAKGVVWRREEWWWWWWWWPFDENLTSPGFLLAFIFSILFSLKLARGFESPLLLCRKEIRGYEFRPPWAASFGPIVMQLARSAAVRNLPLLVGKDLDSRIALDSFDTWHSDRSARISKWGTPPRAPPHSIECHPSLFRDTFYGNSRRSKFLRESRSIIIIYNSIRGWICYILDDSHFNSKIFL